MKQVFSILAFFLLGTLCASAQTSGAVMTFETTTMDYGTIEKGADPIRKFKFTNTGNEPLIIKSAKGSCGCTVPTYPKEPVMPGESSVIEVNYDTNREGMFTKTVTYIISRWIGEGRPSAFGQEAFLVEIVEGIQEWLKDFAYRIPVGISSFVLAGLLTAGIAFYHHYCETLKAATENPVALRSE